MIELEPELAERIEHHIEAAGYGGDRKDKAR